MHVHQLTSKGGLAEAEPLFLDAPVVCPGPGQEIGHTHSGTARGDDLPLVLLV